MLSDKASPEMMSLLLPRLINMSRMILRNTLSCHWKDFNLITSTFILSTSHTTTMLQFLFHNTKSGVRWKIWLILDLPRVLVFQTITPNSSGTWWHTANTSQLSTKLNSTQLANNTTWLDFWLIMTSDQLPTLQSQDLEEVEVSSQMEASWLQRTGMISDTTQPSKILQRLMENLKSKLCWTGVSKEDMLSSQVLTASILSMSTTWWKTLISSTSNSQRKKWQRWRHLTSTTVCSVCMLASQVSRDMISLHEIESHI